MKKLAFMALGSLAMMAGSATSSEACCYRPVVHHCGCWHPVETVAFRDYGPGYVWWDHPYYFYAPYSVVHHVLVHESLEIGPTPVWP